MRENATTQNEITETITNFQKAVQITVDIDTENIVVETITAPDVLSRTVNTI